ncbi:MAG TPA: hypothetical protein QGH10_26745 [Armatimonadota bacterium]|nr:hypothetical protein [Armatimonadota bacterium]
MDRHPAQLAAEYGSVPAAASRAKSYKAWQKGCVDYIYRCLPVTLLTCAALKRTSKPGEDEGTFRAGLSHLEREKRDLEVAKLRTRYESKIKQIRDRIRRAEDKVSREKSEANQHALQATISVGATLVGALFGRKLTSQRNVSRATSALRGAGRSMQQRDDVGRAKETLVEEQANLDALEEECRLAIADLQAQPDPSEFEVAELTVPPRKSDTMMRAFGLVWVPWAIDESGPPQPLYRI